MGSLIFLWSLLVLMLVPVIASVVQLSVAISMQLIGRC